MTKELKMAEASLHTIGENAYHLFEEVIQHPELSSEKLHDIAVKVERWADDIKA